MRNPQQSMTVEDALRLLTKPQRRRIVHLVAEVSGPTSIDRLERDLAGDGGLPSWNEADSPETRQLHHVHLPMLADAGVVTYDEATGTVRPGREFETLASLLDVIEKEFGVEAPE